VGSTGGGRLGVTIGTIGTIGTIAIGTIGVTPSLLASAMKKRRCDPVFSFSSRSAAALVGERW
jgi:hypothetical protein